ncbi:MAG TPA: LITAF-like zinc ribbon domain-containing protein [Acidimicrobiia bacterium]|nr:LITAF-like zinc ribbon domain-containing protein [Acidimicrobiia bacterium]
MRFIECPHCHRMSGISQKDATKRLMVMMSILTVGLAALAWPFVVPKKSTTAHTCERCGWHWEVAAPSAVPGVPMVGLPMQHSLREARRKRRLAAGPAGMKFQPAEPSGRRQPVCAACGRVISAMPTTIEEDIRRGGGRVIGAGLGETLYRGVICDSCRRILCYDGCYRAGSPCEQCGGAMRPLFADLLP